MTTKTPAWYAERYTDKYGFALVPIEPGRKFPTVNDWGDAAMVDAEAATKFYTDHADWNMGLALGPSRMCSLDIDCDESFAVVLEEFGIPLDALAEFPTIQGRSKGRRIMFRVPDGVDLPYAKLNWPTEADPTKRYTVFELRAATDGKQRQDVLPPSIHPDTGKPYSWIVQPPAPSKPWPEPPGWLLAIWGAWGDFKPQLASACPWVDDPVPPPAQKPKREQQQGADVIGEYLSRHDLRSELERYGYKRIGRKRYLSPHTTTGLPGVVMFPDETSCWIHHASDPLCSEENGQPVNAFDLFCEYDHSGDVSKAVKAAADALGLKPAPAERAKPTKQASEIMASNTATPAADAPKPTGPFVALGYSGNSYYYLPRGTEQVAEIRRGSHTSPAEMMALAPVEWWDAAYPKEKGGADWHSAASACMRMCEARGIYSPERERGRGAWYDEGRAVLHLGDRLLVDGTACAIADHRSRFIYTRQAPMETGMDATPATAADAKAALDIFDSLNWNKPVHARLAAGWAALAPICGSLKWRPHIWLTAQRGAGKTWMQDNIMAPLLGSGAMIVQGSTTEAGIRQRLKQDARPIVFDEAESENHGSQKRMQTVIELARQSSSDSSAEIVKGTVGGQGMAFRMRSMFMLGSVNVALSQAADESRFSVLTLDAPDKTPEEIERFDAFSRHVGNTLTPEYCATIRARAYHLMPTVRENAKTLAKAVAELLGSQRIGDQVGTLLAGAWMLESDALLCPDRARQYVQPMDFSDAKEAEQASDEEALLARVLQTQIRFDTSNHGHLSRSVGEVVDCAMGRGGLGEVSANEANGILGRYGLSIDGQYILVSNTHTELKRILSDSPWAAGWRRVLARIPGAISATNGARFAGVKSRATKVPLSFL